MRPASSLWSQSCSPIPLCRQSVRYFSSPVQSTSSNQTWSWPLPKKDLYLAAMAVPQFNSRHVTATSCMPHLSSQTVPHIPSWKISTRPEHRWVPFASRSCLLSIKWIKYVETNGETSQRRNKAVSVSSANQQRHTWTENRGISASFLELLNCALWDGGLIPSTGDFDSVQGGAISQSGIDGLNDRGTTVHLPAHHGCLFFAPVAVACALPVAIVVNFHSAIAPIGSIEHL